MSNSYGENIRLTIFGQSHAPAIGAVVDGLPAGVVIDWERVNAFLARRAPGGELATARREADRPVVLSGLNARGETCGAPLAAMIENGDARSKDYAALGDLPRPGHADFTAHKRYASANDIRGGGASSGRLTAPLCLAGAVCMQLPTMHAVRIGARIASIERVADAAVEDAAVNAALLDRLAAKDFPVVDDTAGAAMREAIRRAREDGDSVGGIVEAYAVGLPAGLGDPMFDGLENKIAQAVFAIPGVRGIEFGAGFAAAQMRGSAHNDPFVIGDCGGIITQSNRHGGILGGISSGMPIVVRVAFKPTPSIARAQRTVSLGTMENRELIIKGRHDPCIVPRAVPCVEAALALALADALAG